MGRANIKRQNGPVLPPAQDFYFNSQALNAFPGCTLCEIVFLLLPVIKQLANPPLRTRPRVQQKLLPWGGFILKHSKVLESN
jgi:hypothetical protein